MQRSYGGDSSKSPNLTPPKNHVEAGKTRRSKGRGGPTPTPHCLNGKNVGYGKREIRAKNRKTVPSRARNSAVSSICQKGGGGKGTGM